VKRGDSLRRIAQRQYGSAKEFTRIVAANPDKIDDPNRIYPGQMLILPKMVASGN
jgi:nucleoid-associated protein YgaU